MIVGIDIGGSTTKIVGVEKDCLISPLKVKADDQLTSAFGAFGKFVAVNGLRLSDIERIMITGVGASFIKDMPYNIPTFRVGEFDAIGFGGRYLSERDNAIIVSMGTGTAFVRVENDNIIHLGGSGVGGGTILGLASKMLNIRRIDQLIELAGQGNLSEVDLTIADISVDTIPNMSQDTTASNFGKMSDTESRADIAAGILNLVFQTIGMMAVFATRGGSCREVVLIGNLTTFPQIKPIFERLESLFDISFSIPAHAEYATALGAALQSIKQTT